MKILIMCLLLCLTVTPVHANEDIRNRINIIAREMAKCQGIIRADGDTPESSGPIGQVLRSATWILSVIKTEELDKIESEAYDKVRKFLEKDTAEAYIAVDDSSHGCILNKTNSENAILGLFDKIGIDYQTPK